MHEALQQLKAHLAANPTRGRAYDILAFMADTCLERPNHEGKLTFEAETLLTGCGGSAEREKEPKDWIPNIRALRRALNLSQPKSGPRLRMGYQPGGGRGNVSLYWLELEPEGDNQSAEVEPSTTVTYRRSANGSVRPSIVARLFLRQGEMRNLSVRGISFLSSKRSINPVRQDGVLFRTPSSERSSMTAALRSPRRCARWADVQAPGAARRRAPGRWPWRSRSGCRSARWPWRLAGCR